MKLPDDIAARFVHHPPRDPSTGEAHAYAREAVAGACAQLFDVVPEGREKALMVTKLEEALMWGNKAIALHGPAGTDAG